MKDWLFNIWELIKIGFGFIPAVLMAVTAFSVISIFLIEHIWLNELEIPYVLYKGSISDAKSLTNVLLQSMVTMATLVVTITMVVLSLAATQLGPRLIQTFTANNTTHIYVGLFFGAVVSCLILLGILHHGALAEPTPGLTISAVIAYCFINFCLLLGYVHHIAYSCVADNIITQEYRDLTAAIKRMTSDEKQPDLHDFSRNSKNKPLAMAFEKSGFIQSIDYASLVDIASARDLYLDINVSAGTYVHGYQTGILLYGKGANRKTPDAVRQDITNCLTIGDKRTSTQDLKFYMRHIVEIGLRALSPGINDHATALACLNRLTTALGDIFGRHIKTPLHSDKNNVLRVQGRPVTAAALIETAFSEILEAGQHKAHILSSGMEMLETLHETATTKDAKDAISFQMKVISTYIHHNFKHTKPVQEKLLSQHKAVSALL
ncbi:MAG: DUF2254 domain-containing protein [Alphaproteobacteria bacterium]|nr:DUF2254 domain-containing protein [Alphaproteobacteria bacterium]